MVRFSIVPARSKVRIEARSSLHPISSTSSGLEGWLELELLGGGRVNTTVPPKGHVELDVERMSTGNGLYDREMRKRVDVRRYPTISADLVGIDPCPREGRYRVQGEITFHGVTRPAEDDLDLDVGADGSLTLTGDSTFDIRDFDLEPPKLLMLRVDPELRVGVSVLARPDVP